MILLQELPLLTEALGGEGGLWRAVLARRRGGDGLPLVEPGLVPPGGPRMLRMAWAPKLMRRVKGVVGAVRAPMPSSSSTAFSSMASEPLVDMLARRALNEVVGEVPRPIVEMESRRPRSLFMAVEMGPGNPGCCEIELLRNMLARLPTEPRRWRTASFGLLLSEDIVWKAFGTDDACRCERVSCEPSNWAQLGWFRGRVAWGAKLWEGDLEVGCLICNAVFGRRRKHRNRKRVRL